jgi:chemotaxis protein CheY-P-specific phosphatase CheC
VSSEVERLTEVANICSGQAASALARLLDVVFLTEPPVRRQLAAGRTLASLYPRTQRTAAIFADLAGALAAEAGLLFTAEALDDVLSRIGGKGSDGESAQNELDVLYEVGNIAVSAAANALADLFGKTALPSVPRAGCSREGELDLRALVQPVERLRDVFDVTLVERRGPLRLRFVLVPGGPDID